MTLRKPLITIISVFNSLLLGWRPMPMQFKRLYMQIILTFLVAA